MISLLDKPRLAPAHNPSYPCAEESMTDLLKWQKVGIDFGRLLAFASRHYGEDPEHLRLSVCKLAGGLSATVLRVNVRFLNPERHSRAAVFVLKRVAGGEIRELGAYLSLAKGPCAPIAPRLFGAERIGSGEVYLYLEYIPRFHPWPWADLQACELVLGRLVSVHESFAPKDVPRWDYDSDLRESAQSTLETVEKASRLDEFAAVRRYLPSVRRLVAALSSLRAQLVCGPWRTALHGDAHTGNAIIRRERSGHSAVLLDWGRIRSGSALEDVSSWLQSLSFWEPEPKRRHDTLLRKYLEGRGMPGELGSDLRERYWLAGASNAFAGALRHHVLQMVSPSNSHAQRTAATAAVRDWLRILARADACWSG